MTKRILIYGFPFFLISLEHVLRAALHLDSETFIAPALAAVGLRLLLPVTVPKNRELGLSQQTRDEINRIGIVIRSRADQQLIDFAWIFILVLTASWLYCLYLTCSTPDKTWIGTPAYQLLGYGNYCVGVVFGEIKEKV